MQSNSNFSLILNDYKFCPPFNPFEELPNVKIEYEVKMDNFDCDLRIYSSDPVTVKEVQKQLKFEPRKSKGEEFKRLGDKVHEYDDIEYWLCNFKTRNFSKFNQKLQQLLEFFIDGVVEIEEDLRWSMLLVYRKRDLEKYDLIGYCSYYHFYNYPESIRVRISQFIIFPPYSNKGHGKKLYEFLMDRFRRDESIVDVTVEDPNDMFQDMRDKSDCRLLLKDQQIQNLKPKLVTKSFLMEYNQKYKLCMKQLVRVIEICILKNINMWDARCIKEYRLWVKSRIYKKNRDVLEEMDFGERLSKLQETYELIEKDYLGLLEKF